MKFIERFGRLVGSTFLFLGIVIQIMCWVAGYTPTEAFYCIMVCLTIAIIADDVIINYSFKIIQVLLLHQDILM